MNSAIERLLSLRVEDVMSRGAVDVSLDQTLEEAASTLHKHGLSGAPVTDEWGHCVGMLTAADFLTQQARVCEVGAKESSLAPLEQGVEHRVCQECADETMHIETVDHEFVRHHMATEVQGIAPSATLLEAGRRMCAAHVHRLPVLDEQRHVVGLVTALDLVAAMVQAVEE